uniref:Uncharacterized protein n=1 Tax=viral metagenome TaxID=1070528 RepID=A0A6C0HS94_9ZZZZ
MLRVANATIERLTDRQEDIDLVTEKATQIEENLYELSDDFRRLKNRLDDIDDEHSRMFLISERMAEKAQVYSLQYSSIEESMGYVLKAMRKHDDASAINRRDVKNMEEAVKRVDEKLNDLLKNSETKYVEKSWKKCEKDDKSVYEKVFPTL